jgi:hypothetical protein
MWNASTKAGLSLVQDGLTPWIDPSWIGSEPLLDLFAILAVLVAVVAYVGVLAARRALLLAPSRVWVRARVRRSLHLSRSAGGSLVLVAGVAAAAATFDAGCASDDSSFPPGAASGADAGAGWGSTSSSGGSSGGWGSTSTSGSTSGSSSGGTGSTSGSTSSSGSTGSSGSTSSSGSPTDGGASSGGTNCVPTASFNSAVFQKEIAPILFGVIDYNTPGQAGTNGGCAKARCHGGTTGSALQLKTSNTTAQNLQSLACFIDAKSPSQSQLLLCPLNDPGCKHYPHPGAGFFTGVTDPNYTRVASWLYGMKGSKGPLDFAFFARLINPIFDDPTLGGSQTGNITCSNAQSCHGVNSPTGIPANGSDFPILPGAVLTADLKANFWAAANLANFYVPQGSQLFLFPTNTIAGQASAANPFTTGLAHPGGLDFSPNSVQAAEILQWATGLQPDPNTGALLNWLAAGPYSAQTITSSTPVGNEATLAPQIFDPNNVGGQWDALISQNANINLLNQFPAAAQTEARVVYAVAYITNATGNDLQANLTIVTPNAAEVFVGGNTVTLFGNNGQNQQTTASAVLPSFYTAQKSTRVLVKLLQAATDQNFNFQISITDQNNQPFSSNQLIVRLDGNGGL